MNISRASCTFYITIAGMTDQKAIMAIPQRIMQEIGPQTEAPTHRQRKITSPSPLQTIVPAQHAHASSPRALSKTSKPPTYLLSLLDGQCNEAHSTLQCLLQRTEIDPTLYSFLGSILAFGKGAILAKPAQALILLEEAIVHDPKDAQALSSLGALLAFGAEGVNRDPQRAQALLHAALKVDPKNARALTFLGCMHAYSHPEITENLEVAVKILEEAIAIQREKTYFRAMRHSIFSTGNLYDLARAEAFLGAINAFFCGEVLVDRDNTVTLFQSATKKHPQEPLYAAWQGLYNEHRSNESAEKAVRCFLASVSEQTAEHQCKLAIFKNSLRIKWSQALIEKYKLQ